MQYRQATLHVGAGLVLLYLMAAGLATWRWGATSEFLAFAGLPPFALAHLLHKAGVPGLLEHGGMCGWGWCEPTPFGWAVAWLVLLVALWAASELLVRAWRAFRGRSSQD